MYTFQLACADTDSFTICKPNGLPFTKEETDRLTLELNSFYPDNINWEFEFNYPRLMVLKAKTYATLDNNGKIKVKGSALKSSTLEPALKDMLNEFINALVFDKKEDLQSIYQKYMDMVDNITDIKPWCTKKTLSPTTYRSERKNETDIVSAVKGSEYGSGDRVYLYVKTKQVETGEYYKVGVRKGLPKVKTVRYYCLAENFDGSYDKDTYYEKIHTTIQRFSTVIDTSVFKKHKSG